MAARRTFPPTPTRRVLVIAASPRTGSTLLCSMLGDSGLAGSPVEYFHRFALRDTARAGRLPRPTLRSRIGRLRRRWSGSHDWDLLDRYTAASLREYVVDLQRTTTSPNGVWATKLMGFQRESLLRCGFDLDDLGLPVTWVRLVRGDDIAQACSQYRARVTGTWFAIDGTRPPVPPYDADAIAEHLAFLRADAAGWDHWFTTNDITPLTLTYEAVAADPAAATSAVLALVGATPPADLAVPLRRQADATTDEWIARFRADRPDLIQP